MIRDADGVQRLLATRAGHVASGSTSTFIRESELKVTGDLVQRLIIQESSKMETNAAHATLQWVSHDRLTSLFANMVGEL